MASSTHPHSQQGADNSLSLSQSQQSQPGPPPPSYTTNSNGSTGGGSHLPFHINFHLPRVSSFASSSFASHQNHHQHHSHPHSPLHEHGDGHEHGEQLRYGTPPPSSLSLTTTTTTTTTATASSTPYASTSYLPSASTSTTTFNAPAPSLPLLSHAFSSPAPSPSPSPSTTTFGSLSNHHPPSVATTMGIPHHQQKDKSQLSIIIDAPYLALKGTGPDVEPTTLSGHVLLHLTESTALKEVTLQFRGKARIPMPANESLMNNSTSITYVVCNHDWSFLESGSSTSTAHTSAHTSSSHHTKKHSRTLKAGNHYFPFSLSIGGTLPSSICTSALGGASVVYKLRAVASRPGFAHNLQAISSVPLLRTFTPEALEYQQTLEIENTWPDKIMYAIMLPHKAWAAGDVMGAIVKFSPLGKGVRVVSVVSTLWETSKVYARSGTQEETKAVCSVRHEIVGGRAVEVDWSNTSGEKPKLGFSFSGTGIGLGISRPASAQGQRDFGYGSGAGPSPSSSSSALTEQARRRQQREEDEEREREMGYENNDVVTCIKMAIPPSSYSDVSAGTSTTTTPTAVYTPPASAPASMSHFPSLSSISHPHSGTSTPNTSAPPPILVTPSHSLEPVVVSHRVRWSIYICNRDGHISELRCSLPVVILDGRVKEEARDASLMSRRMMIRSCVGLDELSNGDEEVWGVNALGEDAGGGGVDGLGGEEGVGRGDRELPSYNAHVRDRVANMFLPEAATIRVNNPWINRSGPTSPAAVADGTGDHIGSAISTTVPNVAGVGDTTTTTTTTDFTPESSGDPHAHVMSHLPHAPSASGASTPLDWVNSELLLSLGDEPLRRFGGGSIGTGGGGGGSGDTGMGPGTGTFSPVPIPAGMRTPPSVLQYVAPVPGVGTGSRWGSRVGSRTGSRAGSPERGGGGDHHNHQPHQSGVSGGEERDREGRSRPSSPVNAPASIGYVYEPLSPAPFSTGSGHGSQGESSSSHHHHHTDSSSHGSGHGIRNLHNLFKATMKPFTALGHKHRHDDKDKDHHHHHREEGRSGSRSREGSSGRNSISSREHSPTTDAPATSAASTYTHTSDSSLNSSLSTSYGIANDPFASVPAEEHLPAPTHPNAALAHPSMSTSELAALRRAAISSPYADANLQQQQLQQQYRQHQIQQQLTGPALLHRAFTEVPDYAIASRGFIGGVPPLSSMRGLPSYQEAVGHSHSHSAYQQGGRRPSPLSGNEVDVGEFLSATMEPDVNMTGTPLPARRRSALSEPDLTSHFALALSQSHQGAPPSHVLNIGHHATALEEEEPALAEGGVGILQRLESAGAGGGLQRDGDEEGDEEEGGIEMRMRSHTITQSHQ